jgi:hypothetical protein
MSKLKTNKKINHEEFFSEDFLDDVFQEPCPVCKGRCYII